ncbi:sensor histidine kinase [Nocardioides zeicaulis]|uniref:histidine kinase n=1 Tax=Nocardioides zeicaulis TaxID=1776857 RepID=A0ABV6E4F6_9ACTN
MGTNDAGARTRAPRPSLGVVAASLALLAAVVGYAVSDTWWVDRVCYDGTLLCAAVLAWVGAERGPRAGRTVPRLVALGISLSALGDFTWDLLDRLGLPTDVTVADPMWMSSYVALAGAVWLVIVRSRSDRGRDPAFVVDVLTVVVVSVLVFWRFAVGAILGQEGLGPLAKVVWASYPVLDAVLLAVVARALLSPRARSALGTTFALGVSVWLLSDTGSLVTSYEGLWRVVIDAGWMVAPVLMARSAWRSHPDPNLGAVGDTGLDVLQEKVRGWRASLGIAVVPLLVPSALEVSSDMLHAESHPWALALGSVLLVALALVRTALLMSSEERHVRELVAARDAALEASLAKSLFVATMSHEFRTPLTTLVGSLDMVRDTTLDDDQRFLVERMDRASTRLRALVEDVLDFSAIEAGRLHVDEQPFDLHRMLDDLLDDYRSVADRSGVGLSWHRDAGVPCQVVGDVVRLQQVLGNLLDNAFKFTPSGSIALRVATVRTSPERPEIVFSVSDTGIGIPADRLEAVFESFTQVDGSTTRPYEGSGLGLTIARRLAEAMGGTLQVTSEPGRGSTFEATLPLRPVPAAPVPR